jgi:hypothetical protein
LQALDRLSGQEHGQEAVPGGTTDAGDSVYQP